MLIRVMTPAVHLPPNFRDQSNKYPLLCTHHLCQREEDPHLQTTRPTIDVGVPHDQNYAQPPILRVGTTEPRHESTTWQPPDNSRISGTNNKDRPLLNHEPKSASNEPTMPARTLSDDLAAKLSCLPTQPTEPQPNSDFLPSKNHNDEQDLRNKSSILHQNEKTNHANKSQFMVNPSAAIKPEKVNNGAEMMMRHGPEMTRTNSAQSNLPRNSVNLTIIPHPTSLNKFEKQPAHSSNARAISNSAKHASDPVAAHGGIQPSILANPATKGGEHNPKAPTIYSSQRRSGPGFTPGVQKMQSAPPRHSTPGVQKMQNVPPRHAVPAGSQSQFRQAPRGHHTTDQSDGSRFAPRCPMDQSECETLAICQLVSSAPPFSLGCQRPTLDADTKSMGSPSIASAVLKSENAPRRTITPEQSPIDSNSNNLRPTEIQSDKMENMSDHTPANEYNDEATKPQFTSSGPPKSEEIHISASMPNLSDNGATTNGSAAGKCCQQYRAPASSCKQQENGPQTVKSVSTRQFVVLPSPPSNLAQARSVLRHLLNIKWPVGARQSHTARLAKFIAEWFGIQNRHGQHMPAAQMQCDIILKLIRPWELKDAVEHIARYAEGWHRTALTDTHVLEAIIRQECERLDDEAVAYRITREPKLLPIAQLVVDGDITRSHEDYIIHQTNCISTRAIGLARYIFHKFPYADTYTARDRPAQPGTIDLCGTGTTRQHIVNMNAQYFPGQPRSNGTDSRQHRVRYFAQCLRALTQHIGDRHEHPCRVAVPWRIGCGLAMGEWRVYASLIMHWSKTTRTADGRSIQVVVYQLPPQNRT